MLLASSLVACKRDPPVPGGVDDPLLDPVWGLLAEAGDGSLALTDRGRMLSDSVFERFV